MKTDHTLFQQKIVLDARSALFWPVPAILVIADVHLGKASHFSKHGIALPLALVKRDLQQLDDLLHDYNPKRVVFLGDLFHATPNVEWQIFSDWLQKHPDFEFDLVLGNHDFFVVHHEINAQLNLYEKLNIEPFIFTHHPLETVPEGHYNLCGHVHPGVRLSGKGRLSLRLPCFWFGKNQGILPAFGNLTGSVALKGKADVFAIAENEIIKM